MQSRPESAIYSKNRATGYSDADWGALEKRLSDTRDLLRDILVHLRRVLDNLKTAGDHYQSTGRAWRKSDSTADGQRRQWGHRQEGPAAGARNFQGTTGARFQSASSQSTASSGAGTSSTRQTTFTSNSRTAGSSTFTSSDRTAGPSTAGGTKSSASDRQAGSGFSWSARAKAGDTSSSTGRTFTGTGGATGTGSASTGGASASSAGAGARPGAGASEQRKSWRDAGTAGRASAGQGAKTGSDWRTGSAGAGAAGSAGRAGGQERAQQAGAQNDRQEHRHRTTGPGGGSSYQEYKQRSHKSPLGHGRMTLTQACALLSITYPCTADDIKAAYRKQARRHHPDLGGDEEMMKSINQAYELALSWCSPLRGKTTATWAA